MSEILDLYAPLNHIPAMGNDRHRYTPTWVPKTEQRRLAAYEVFSRLTANRAATLRTDPGAAQSLREYGDVELLVTTTRDLILGETQTLRCDDETALTWFTEWATKERLEQKLLTLEHDAVQLGDGVAVLGWNTLKNRPVLRVYNPGFYFPAPTIDDDEYPSTVAIAYEWENTSGTKFVRRYLWQLIDTRETTSFKYGSAGTFTCMYAAHDIRLDSLTAGRDVHDLTMGSVQYSLLTDQDGESVEFVDMGVDFIPVVHVPNTPSTEEDFGESVLLYASQALADLQNSDTDLAMAAQQAAPPLVTDEDYGDLPGGPGAVWGTGTGTKYLDTSKNLTALQSHISGLKDRIAETTRVSKVLLGQVQPNEVPSGYALELGFHPSRNLLQSLRTVRSEKYPLILKFAYRLAQTAGATPSGKTPHAWIELGAALPADKPTAIDQVKEMRSAKAMSTVTAVKTLQAAGFPIEDAQTEVALIKQEWFEEAYNLVRATGDATAARTLLGLAAPTVRTVEPETPNE